MSRTTQQTIIAATLLAFLCVAPLSVRADLTDFEVAEVLLLQGKAKLAYPRVPGFRYTGSHICAHCNKAGVAPETRRKRAGCYDNGR